MPTKCHLQIGFALIILFSFARCTTREPNLKDIEGPPSMSSTVANAPEVSFCELVRNSARHDRAVVRTNAILRVDRENQVLYDPRCDHGDSYVWADFDPSCVYSNEQVKSTLAELLRRTAQAPTRYVQVALVGRFEGPTTDGYGHLDGYRYRFSIMRVEQAERFLSPANQQ
jgi:hypothetical protein